MYFKTGKYQEATGLNIKEEEGFFQLNLKVCS